MRINKLTLNSSDCNFKSKSEEASQKLDEPMKKIEREDKIERDRFNAAYEVSRLGGNFEQAYEDSFKTQNPTSDNR